MKEIGSHFHLSSEELNIINHLEFDLSFFNQSKQKLFLSSGRQAINLCLKDSQLDQKKNVKKVALLPEYTCASVIQPFIDSGYSIVYYPVDIHLQLQISTINQLIQKHDVSVWLFHPYFGFESIIEDEPLHKQELTVIFDHTQSYGSQLDYAFWDYQVVSLRKWGPLIDGGLAIKKHSDFHEHPINSQDEHLVESMLVAFQNKDRYFKDQSFDKNIFLSDFTKAFKLFNQTQDFYEMSELSKKTFLWLELNQDDSWAYVKRFDNYKILAEFEHLGKPLFQLEKGNVPLYFPFYLTDISRELFQKELAKQNIYCPIIWPVPTNMNHSDLSKTLEALRQNLICIPIDQRYDSDDMMRIKEAMTKLLYMDDSL